MLRKDLNLHGSNIKIVSMTRGTSSKSTFQPNTMYLNKYPTNTSNFPKITRVHDTTCCIYCFKLNNKNTWTHCSTLTLKKGENSIILIKSLNQGFMFLKNMTRTELVEIHYQHTILICWYIYYMLFIYQTGYIMWHSRLMIYIPRGAAEGNIFHKPGMSHYIPCLIAE